MTKSSLAAAARGTAVLASIAGAVATADGQPARFEMLDNAGFFFAVPRYISADGSVIAGDLSQQFGGVRAARWVYPGPVVQNLGPFMGQDTSVDHLSRDGQTVYGATSFNALRWTSPGPFVIDPHGRTLDVTPDGAVRIVTNQRQVGANPPENLGVPSGYDSGVLRAIDASGAVIIGEGVRVESGGGYLLRNKEFREAARWSVADGWQGLGFLPGDGYSTGLHISDDGAVLVGASRADESGADRVWRIEGEGPMVDLGTIPGFAGAPTVPVDMSADGSVIVGTVMAFSGTRCFLWTPSEGMRDLETHLRGSGQDLDDWQVLSVEAVSADGQYVLGRGVTPTGQVRGFVAPLFAVCAPPSASLADEYGVVFARGELLSSEPGEPVCVSLPLFPPMHVASDGVVASRPTLSSGVSSVFVGLPPAFVRVGDVAPGGGTFDVLGDFIVKAGESALISAGIGPVGSAVLGLWSGTPGNLGQIVRVGGLVGGQTVTGLLGQALHNNHGRSAFIVQFSGGFSFVRGSPGVVASYNISAATTAQFPKGVVFTTPSLQAFNDSDQVALTEAISYAEVPLSADTCIMVRSVGQTTNQIRALEGEPAPDQAPGVRFGDLLSVRVSMNSSGRIAFRAPLTNGEAGVFVETESGLRGVATTGRQAPGEPEGVTLFTVDTPIINDHGRVVFHASLIGPGVDGTHAVFLSDDGVAASAVFRGAGIAPGLGACAELIGVLAPIVLNNAGQVLIPAAISAGGGSVVRNALYLLDPERGLFLVAGKGSAIELASEDVRTIARVDIVAGDTASTSEGRRVTLADDGSVVFRAEFTDQSEAYVRARVTPPAAPALCPGDANGDGVVNFADITSVLTFWLFDYAPGTGAGDANHDGVVNFADITAVLTFSGVPCK
ncbi:MAG: hypothetical protein JNK58_09305 [Phycisphaerae bacterium]|nr:hypothetical protein [Phycisphaerae bacterium]